MAITDVPNTQVYAVALGTTATGFRAPAGAHFAYVRRTDVAVAYQVADETADDDERDLEGTNLSAPAAGAPIRPCAGPVPADSWHLIQLSDADAPCVGDQARRSVLYLQAAEAFPVEAEKCWVRFTRSKL